MSRPTMEDVASAAGVSRSLVSLVFQDSPKVAQASRERVLAEAERLGYRPNVLARQLASNRTRTIGILLDDLHNPYFADVLVAFESAAEAAGYRALLANGRRDGERESEAMRTFVDHRVDGIILASPRVSEAELAAMAKLAPMVCVERPIELPRVDVVLHDGFVGVDLILDHLTALGHSRIAHVDGGEGAGSASRRDHFVRRTREIGIADTCTVIAGEFTEAAGRAAAEQLLHAGDLPTAIYCANDAVAAGVAAVLQREGIAIPDDVSLVGYDDTVLASLDLLSLTSVRQPLEAMAKKSIEVINRRIEHPRRAAEVIAIAPELVVRRSTAAPRA